MLLPFRQKACIRLGVSKSHNGSCRFLKHVYLVVRSPSHCNELLENFRSYYNCRRFGGSSLTPGVKIRCGHACKFCGLFLLLFLARSIVVAFVSSDVKIARLFLVLTASAVNSRSSLILINTIESCWRPSASLLLTWLFPPQRLPLGIPYENNNNRNNRKRAGDDGKREKAVTSFLSSPFPSFPAHSLFLSPQPPHNIKRPLRRRELTWRTPVPNATRLLHWERDSYVLLSHTYFRTLCPVQLL